jgi:4-hydroxybenzoate polyprenyltransferase/phosphoserine phosphatase
MGGQAASASSGVQSGGRPICVDLDGTLIATDLLWESFISLVKQRPFLALKCLLALAVGKAAFKRKVADSISVDPTVLPYRAEVMNELLRWHREGRRLVLATASDERYAVAIANHLGIFRDVVASDGRSNMSGHTKATALSDRYGQKQFDYLGNDWNDLPVWAAAAEGTAVSADARVTRHALKKQVVQHTMSPRPSTLRSLIRACRPYQWVKNLLVFVPLIAAHKFVSVDDWITGVLAFAVFSFSASAIYILNDIADIQSDRLHPRKRHRPFAAGDLSIPVGIATSAVLLALAFAVAVLAVSWSLAVIAAVYLIATSAYSLGLKRQPVVDVFMLTGLYVLRIVAGGVATDTPLSSWLLAFALFVFLSLAFVKRYVELMATEGWIAGRGYRRDDAMWMHAIGTSAGYMASLVLALYVNSPEVAVLYTQPQGLWLLCPLLLFWITRLWFRAGRRVVHDDPILEAVRDPFSYLAAAVMLGVMFWSI